jgi:hypothetical protein
MTEPDISINGHQLSSSQAMAVRVAINDLFQWTNDPAIFGSDECGRAMNEAYRNRLDEVMRMMGARA